MATNELEQGDSHHRSRLRNFTQFRKAIESEKHDVQTIMASEDEDDVD